MLLFQILPLSKYGDLRETQGIQERNEQKAVLSNPDVLQYFRWLLSRNLGSLGDS